MTKVMVITASNGKNLELAKEFEETLKGLDIQSSVLDIVEQNLPLYSPAEEERGLPDRAKALSEEMKEYDGFVFIAPEYNGGLPPTLTNLIAWISRSGGKDWREVFNSKSAAIASFSGNGGIQALVAMRIQLSYIGLNVIGRQVRGTFQGGVKEGDVLKVANLLKNSL